MHSAKPHEETHSGAGAAAEINAGRSFAYGRLVGQSLRRPQTPDVNLLAHHEFPEIELGTTVHGLYVAELNAAGCVHVSPQFKALKPSTL